MDASTVKQVLPLSLPSAPEHLPRGPARRSVRVLSKAQTRSNLPGTEGLERAPVDATIDPRPSPRNAGPSGDVASEPVSNATPVDDEAVATGSHATGFAEGLYVQALPESSAGRVIDAGAGAPWPGSPTGNATPQGQAATSLNPTLVLAFGGAMTLLAIASGREKGPIAELSLDRPVLAAGQTGELRIVFDRARYLEEQGYAVQLRTFCARSETPRNLLLEAWRHPD